MTNDGVEKTTLELQDLFGRLGKMQAEVSWFLFTLGQLGAIVQLDDKRVAEGAIELMRKDVTDFTMSAAVLADKMTDLLDSAEAAIAEEQEAA